jgi:hypothetical protein
MIDMEEHEHAFSDAVRVDVYQVHVTEAFGPNWDQLIETMRYRCACGEVRDIEIKSEPPTDHPNY